MSYLDQLKNNFKKKKREEILLEQTTLDIHSKIISFFSENPNPSDDQVHAYAEILGIKPHDFEQHIYMILGSFLGAGRSKDFKGSYDPKELKMGIKIEMEHTTDPKISERIVKDHLAEIPGTGNNDGYYSKLKKMEKEAGIE